MKWTPLIGAVAGCLLVFGALFGILWFKKRKREQRGERPPQEEKLLRPPGYFAVCRLDELTEKLAWVVLQAVASGAVFGTVVATLWPVAAQANHRKALQNSA